MQIWGHLLIVCPEGSLCFAVRSMVAAVTITALCIQTTFVGLPLDMGGWWLVLILCYSHSVVLSAWLGLVDLTGWDLSIYGFFSSINKFHTFLWFLHNEVAASRDFLLCECILEVWKMYFFITTHIKNVIKFLKSHFKFP